MRPTFFAVLLCACAASSPTSTETIGDDLDIDPALSWFSSNLPLVVLDTHGVNIADQDDDIHHPVNASFIGVDPRTGRAEITGEADFSGPAGMHIRGASSRGYDKKQYKIETWNAEGEDEAVSLFGMPKEADWILHAPFSDKTLMRNHLIYKWSNDIGRYAPRTRLVEVFMAQDGGRVGMDDYLGVYLLAEKIERDGDRVDLERLLPEHGSEPEITGGYLLKKDWLEDDDFFETDRYGDGIIFVDPEVDELTAGQRGWVEDHFNAFEDALASPDFADPVAGYGPFVDADSFHDHHLLVEMARNVDGFVLSTFLSKDRNGPITMGPIWDYNGSLGNADYFESYEIEGWHHEFDDGEERFPADNPNGYRWYERMFEDPVFQARYAERWRVHREGPLSTERLMADIDEVVAVLTDGGAVDNPVQRNFERWPILEEYVWPNYLCCGSYEEQVAWLKEWLGGRVVWMDGELQ
jgi:hypothetical protein